MSLTDWLTLKSFYLVDCQRHVRIFEFADPSTQQTWLVRFDPASPPTWRPDSRNPEKYNVIMTLLEDSGGAYGDGEYGEQYYDS